jgi:SAM-dependent methyltransferase
VREVVGVDLVPELLERGREYAAERFANVELVEGDVAHLPFERGEFDLVCERAVLHHVQRPELVVAEVTRVTRPGGRVLVIDQLAPFDPLAAIELDRFERARDPSHTRLLSDGDLRAMCEMNGLVLIRSRVERHDRHLDPYLDLSGCEGDAREHAHALAPGDPYEVETGWYLLRRP